MCVWRSIGRLALVVTSSIAAISRKTLAKSGIGLAYGLFFVGGAAAQTVTESGGAAGSIPVFTSASAVTKSVITQSGSSIGVGTTTPAATLQVLNPTNANGQTGFQVSQATGGNYDLTAARVQSIDDGNYIRFLHKAATWGAGDYIDANGYFNVKYSGYVGIGTTTPIAVLQVVNPVSLSGQVGFQVNQATAGNIDLTAARVQSTDDGNYIRFLHKATTWGAGDYIDANGYFNVKYSGNVGIGTTTPSALLEVNGNEKIDGIITFPDNSQQQTAWTGVLCGGDYAESVNASGDLRQYEAGDVLVLSSGEGADVEKSSEPYSTMVAGVYSTKPGLVGRRQTTPKSSEELPMAMVGVVPTKVSAENGPIKRGDLLVTSSLFGYAMKGSDRSRMLGAVVGKAMGSLDSGQGVIEILISLQ